MDYVDDGLLMVNLGDAEPVLCFAGVGAARQIADLKKRCDKPGRWGLMFDMAAFIKDNLINGYQNGSFTREQVNIYALNYGMADGCRRMMY